MPGMAHDNFRFQEGIFVLRRPLKHRQEDYSEESFATLSRMESSHFWYRGRHKFLFWHVRRIVGCDFSRFQVLDMGAGTGAWTKYLLQHKVQPRLIAVADSSPTAVKLARESLPNKVVCYQTDILEPVWDSEWDIIFCLDVLEHLTQPEQAVTNLRRALKPNGLLFITVPALKVFWSWVDEMAQHKRRYSRKDLAELAKACQLRVVDIRYFMFLLSPLVWVSRRLIDRKVKQANPELRKLICDRHHRVPTWLINEILYGIFALEAPLSCAVRFPWGTSLLGVFRRTNG